MKDLQWFEVSIENAISFDDAQTYISDVFDVSKSSVYDEDRFWTMEKIPSEPYITISVVLSEEKHFATLLRVDCFPHSTKSTLDVGQYFQKRCQCNVAVPLPRDYSKGEPWDGSLAVFYQDGRKFTAYCDQSNGDFKLTDMKEVSSY